MKPIGVVAIQTPRPEEKLTPGDGSTWTYWSFVSHLHLQFTSEIVLENVFLSLLFRLHLLLLFFALQQCMHSIISPIYNVAVAIVPVCESICNS